MLYFYLHLRILHIPVLGGIILICTPGLHAWSFFIQETGIGWSYYMQCPVLSNNLQLLPKWQLHFTKIHPQHDIYFSKEA